jgi:hypothetical protein
MALNDLKTVNDGLERRWCRDGLRKTTKEKKKQEASTSRRVPPECMPEESPLKATRSMTVNQEV